MRIERGTSRGGIRYSRRQRGIKLDSLKEVIAWVWEIALVIVITALAVYFFCYGVDALGPSMSPTLDSGDRVFMERLTYRIVQPQANDLIAYSYGTRENSQIFIKRVIGVPGDTVQIINGNVFVNGQPFQERENFGRIENPLIASEPIRVGENEYFVLGDNRNNSEDSRFAGIGNIDAEYIRGRVWFRIGPFSRFGIVR